MKHVKKCIGIMIILVLFVGCLMPVFGEEEPQWYVGETDSGSRVNLRKDPGGTVIGEFYTGTPMERLDYSETEWIEVRIGSLEGYMYSEYVTSTKPEKIPVHIYSVKNGKESTNFRSSPREEDNVIEECFTGDEVQVLGKNIRIKKVEWSYVKFGDNMGYIQSRFLTKAETITETPDDFSAEEIPAPEATGFSQADTEFVEADTVGMYSHTFTTDNGQTLNFLAADRTIYMRSEDVNFDNHLDLVFTTSRGAANTIYALFIWNGTEYVPATTPALPNGFANYVLNPLKKCIVSNYSADGTQHDICIFRWEGTEPVLMRRGQCWQNADAQLQVSITDYTTGEGAVVYDVTPDEERLELWKGI